MKKTILITAIALVFSAGNINASEVPENSDNYKVEKIISNVNAFCISIAKGDTETVQKLISLGEDVNKKSNGMTPLMYAARFNRVDILKMLIANGADLKSKSKKGLTALKYAKLSSAKDAVIALELALTKKKGVSNASTGRAFVKPIISEVTASGIVADVNLRRVSPVNRVKASGFVVNAGQKKASGVLTGRVYVKPIISVVVPSGIVTDVNLRRVNPVNRVEVSGFVENAGQNVADLLAERAAEMVRDITLSSTVAMEDSSL